MSNFRYAGGVTPEEDRFRIGELSRRTGLSEHVLRAWERRYGVLDPERSSGGFRLYSPDDERRVRQMQDALARGLSPAEAARTAVGAGEPVRGPLDLGEAVDRLADALEDYDATRAHDLLSELLATGEVDQVLRETVLPVLRRLGDRWEHGEVSVGQEHFASNLLRARLAGLMQEVPAPARTALLACPPGEQHDLPLLIHAVCLSRRGWRTVFLGADVPLPDLVGTAHSTQPDLVVVAATTPAHVGSVIGHLRLLARATTVALGGRGATVGAADRAGALLLTADPVTEAERLSELVAAPVPTPSATPGTGPTTEG